MSTSTDKETWQNPGKGDVWILVFNHEGKLESRPIRSGGKIHLTTQERMINQERAWSKDADLFSNGRLQPVRLLDTAEDYRELASNPNHLSENDLKAILKLKGAPFTNKLAKITNKLALERLVEIAQDDSLNVTMNQFKALEARIEELTPEQKFTEVTERPL